MAPALQASISSEAPPALGPSPHRAASPIQEIERDALQESQRAALAQPDPEDAPPVLAPQAAATRLLVSNLVEANRPTGGAGFAMVGRGYR